MSDNGYGVRRHDDRSISIGAPPAHAFGDAPLPGALVPTPQRLAAPTLKLEVTVAFSQLPELVRALFEVIGDEFQFVLNPQVLAALSPNDLARLQKVMQEREDRRG